jgi:hypothetical protein
MPVGARFARPPRPSGGNATTDVQKTNQAMTRAFVEQDPS